MRLEDEPATLNEVFYDNPHVLDAALKIIETGDYAEKTFVTVSVESADYYEQATFRSFDDKSVPNKADDGLLINIEVRIPNYNNEPVGELYREVMHDLDRRKNEKDKTEIVTLKETIARLEAQLEEKK